jgi:hypothetical protein
LLLEILLPSLDLLLRRLYAAQRLAGFYHLTWFLAEE